MAADYICTLASHSCYGHNHSLADEQTWTRPKSLWDVAQHTDSLLKILPHASSTDTSTISYRPLKNQKLPHINQYAHVDWKSLYGADDPLNRARGQLSFKLSQDEAFRRLGGRINLKRRWDVDSVMFRTTTLGVFNEGAELCFYPPFDRSIKQNPNVTFHGCKIHDCKNLLLAYRGASMIRWDCHLITPNLPKTSRLDTRQFTDKQIAFWTDKILLPAIRRVCDSDKTNHLPRSFAEAHDKAWTRGETTVVNHYQRAGPTDGSTETVGLGLSRAGKHSSIGCYLQQEDLEEVWKEVLTIIQHGLASESDAMFKDFNDCFLVVSSHGTKMATKGRDHTLSSAKTKFRTLFDRAFDTRPEIIPREDFYVDNGHEITPEKGSDLVLLRKTGCLDHLRTSYACQTSGTRKVSQDSWKWALTNDAGTTKIVTSKTNSLRQGGLVDVKAYNINKDIFIGLDRGLPPFGEVKLEGLAFDPDVLNRWLEHNKQGSSQHGGAGPRTRETLLDILRQIKRRLDNALRTTKHETFGVRAEERMNIELFDLLQEPDSTWLEDITVEEVEARHLPFWILPADHVEAFWRSEIDRWLFGFERQIATVNSKDHQINSQQQFINSATAAIFLRTLQNVPSKGSTGRPLQLWRSEYETKETKMTVSGGLRRQGTKRYGLGFEDSLKAWGMPYIDVDLLLWGVLAIKPSKLGKTAFSNSFGFELGFKKKVRQLGKDASKASEVLNRQDWEDRCLREYLSRLREPHENIKIVSQLRHAKKKVVRITSEIEQARADKALPAAIADLEKQKDLFDGNVEMLFKAVANHFREDLRLPTEMVIQQYIRDVFMTLAGTKSDKREAVPGLKNLSKAVLDGRRGLNWLTFAKAFSQLKQLIVPPLISLVKEEPSNLHQGNATSKTLSKTYTFDWKGRMDGLFRINDNVTRHRWEDKPYRKKTRHLYAIIEQTLIPDIAKIWESELGEAACRYLWAVPSFDSSNFSAIQQPSKKNSEASQASIKKRSIGHRTKINVPRFRPSTKIKFSKDDMETANLLHDLIRLIPNVKPDIPNSGFKDEEIGQMIKHIRLGQDDYERDSMVSKLKAFLTRPHVYMDVAKTAKGKEGDLPTPDLWGNARLYELEKDRSHFSFGTTAEVPLLPIFDDLMSLKCLEDFYHEVEEAIDRDKEEGAEEEDLESEQESGDSSEE